MLEIPERFDKNAPQVRRMGPPAETGRRLIDYMCERAGLADLGQSDVLDFGCGCRFAASFVNLATPVKSYIGLDLDEEMIDFLQRNVVDTRLKFIRWNARNPYYNREGKPLEAFKSLPVGRRKFDLICMFSVITHQVPEDARLIFTLLRRHVRRDGQLFFSAIVEDMDSDYREMEPSVPGAASVYTKASLTGLLERTGWRVVSHAPKNPRPLTPIQDSFVCLPV
jgi:SAM-dependent methyltransferase